MIKNHIEAIKVLSKIVGYEKYLWFIIGGTNLTLHGIDHYPKDIDIYCRKDAYEKFKEYFSYAVEDKNDDFSQFKVLINDVEVEIFYEERGDFYKKYLDLKFIDLLSFKDIKVPFLKLTEQAKAYMEVFENGRGIDTQKPLKAIINTNKILIFLVNKNFT